MKRILPSILPLRTFLTLLVSMVSLHAQVTSVTTAAVTGDGSINNVANLQTAPNVIEAVNFYDPNNSTSTTGSTPHIDGVTYAAEAGNTSTITYSPSGTPGFTLTNIYGVENARTNVGSGTPIYGLTYSGLLPNAGSNPTMTLTLTGLTVGTTYVAQCIFCDYGDSYTRSLTVADGGKSATANDGSGGTPNYVNDTFKATATTETITITGNTALYLSGHFSGFNLATIPLIPPIPTITTGPTGFYSVFGPQYGDVNDIEMPWTKLSDGSGIMAMFSAENITSFTGADVDHMGQVVTNATFNDASGDNGNWHKNLPPGQPSGNLIWFTSLNYATDGQLVGTFYANSTTDYTAEYATSVTGVATSPDKGKTWNIAGQVPAGMFEVPAPTHVPGGSNPTFYWFSIGNEYSYEAPNYNPPGVVTPPGYHTGTELFASTDVHGAPGSWYGWNGTDAKGNNVWVAYPLSLTFTYTSLTALPTLATDSTIQDNLSETIDNSYLAAQNGQAHEYINLHKVNGTIVLRFSYDYFNWSGPVTIATGLTGSTQYVKLNGLDSDAVGGQDMLLTQQDYNLTAPPNSSRHMQERWVHFGTVTAPAAPTLRDALPSTQTAPAVRLSWTDTQAQSYTIYRKTGTGSFTSLTTVPAVGSYTDYVDQALVAGQTYQYYVTATNSVGTSVASNTATAVANGIAHAYSLQTHEGLVIDGSAATTSGSVVTLNTASGALGQTWSITPVNSLDFEVLNLQTNLALSMLLNVPNGYSNTGTGDVETYTGNNRQYWEVDNAASYYYFNSADQFSNGDTAQSELYLWDPFATVGSDLVADPNSSQTNGDKSMTIITQGAPLNGVVWNASFETPPIASGATSYSPVYNYWTFLPVNSGSGGNASGLSRPTSPAAPDGAQAAFIEKSGSISQNVILFPGTYTINFSAAQKSGAAQTISVYVDGLPVGSVTPTGSSYATYSVGPIPITGITTLVSGVSSTFDDFHHVSFVGTTATDGVVLLDNVKVLGGSLVGQWNFDENTGTTTANSSADKTVGSGTIVHTASWSAPGHNGRSCLNFVASSQPYVSVPNTPSLNITTAISLAAWVNAVDWNGGRRIIEKGGDPNGSPGGTDSQYALTGGTGGISFSLYGVGSVTATTPPSTGAWHHVAGTWDGATMKIYIDGTQAASQAATGTIGTSATPLIIGDKSTVTTTTTDAFNGLLDDVRVYNRALTQSEVTNLSQEAFLTDGAIYTFSPACASGFNLEVASSPANNVDIYTANSGSSNQQWKAFYDGNGYWEFQPQSGLGQRLDVFNTLNAPGTNVDQYFQTRAPAQLWKLYSAGTGAIGLEPQCAPGQRLDDYAYIGQNNNNVQIYTFGSGDTAQGWIYTQR